MSVSFHSLSLSLFIHLKAKQTQTKLNSSLAKPTESIQKNCSTHTAKAKAKQPSPPSQINQSLSGPLIKRRINLRDCNLQRFQHLFCCPLSLSLLLAGSLGSFGKRRLTLKRLNLEKEQRSSANSQRAILGRPKSCFEVRAMANSNEAERDLEETFHQFKCHLLRQMILIPNSNSVSWLAKQTSKFISFSFGAFEASFAWKLARDKSPQRERERRATFAN